MTSSSLRILIAAHIRWHNAEADYALRLAKGLLRKGHRVLVWGKPNSPLLEKAKAGGVETVAGPDPSSLSPTAMIESTRLIERLVKEGGVNVVDAIRSEGYPVVARAAYQAGAAVVRTRADMRPPRFGLVNGPIVRQWTHAVITGNDLIRENLILGLKLPPEMVSTVYLGIDPEEMPASRPLEEMRAELGLSPADRVVGIMGRLGPVKGQEFVLKGVDKIAAAAPSVKFLVLYRDVEKSDKFLPALARSPHRDRFLLMGPRPDHREYMRLCQAAVIPSVGSEAHCRVALEWMALSVPVVGSRVGVIPEIIVHGGTGFLAQPRYSDAIATCLIALLSDPPRAREMGEKGRARLVEKFTADKMVDGNLAVYQKALAQAGR